MCDFQLLLVAGTHGNEINAPFLIEQWKSNRSIINSSDLKIIHEIGNPKAFNAMKRYIDQDLNRSFQNDLSKYSNNCSYELERANTLLSKYGLNGKDPCQIAIDLHTTTASMGSSLVIYGRRPVDLALASLLQNRLGLPVYLHQNDPKQKGFLVEAWPCGLVIEIGPVAQSLIDISIVKQYIIILNILFEEIAKVINSNASFPESLIVYSHLGSIDFPRDSEDKITALIHPDIYSYNWKTIKNGHPLFLKPNGVVIRFDRNKYPDDHNICPVFINEAAYAEKNIAMSITSREKLIFSESWHQELKKLILD